MIITIAMGINHWAPGWNIFRMVSEQYQNVEMVCSIIFIKQSFHGTVLEKFLMIALEKFVY